MKNLYQSAFLLLLTGALLTACSSNTPTSHASDTVVTNPTSSTPAGTREMQLAPPALPDGQNLRELPNLDGPRTPLTLRPQWLNANTGTVGLKILILSAGSGDADLDTAKTMLDQEGIPYDVIRPEQTGGLSEAQLVNANGSGKYQGVILTTGSLAYEASPGVWQSALDWTGWNLLWQYENDFAVRQLSLYTYPSTWPEDYGLRDAGAASASADLRLTAGGQGLFNDLKAGVNLPVRNAYNYPATVASVPGVTTTPLLTDASGRVLAATSTVGGRERLALTFAQNPYLLHSALLGHTLTKWLTKGIHLGEYRRFNQLDIDDWFLSGELFDLTTNTLGTTTYRMTAADALGVKIEQDALRQRFPVASAFTFTMMYNGEDANLSAPLSCNPAAPSPDGLSSMTRCLAGQFHWVSHTLTHEYMDFLTYAESTAELRPNLKIAGQLGLRLNPKSLVSGNMSGLGYYNAAGNGSMTDYGLGASNTAFLQAAVDSGARYLASNHSLATQWDANCAGCGLVHPLNSQIFLVPRWPTNVAYSVTNPTQQTAFYNSIYGPTGSLPYWPRNLTYAQILEQESNIALAHVLSGGAFPHYMHQNNLRQYAPSQSLAYDWQVALLDKYSSYSTLPLNTLRWDDLGAYMQSRTNFLKSGVSGTWNRAAHTLTVTSGTGGPVYLTGAAAGTTVNYGGQTISTLPLGAGQSVTVNVP